MPGWRESSARVRSQLVAGLGREGEAELDHAAGLMLGHAEAGGQAGGARLVAGR